MVFFQLLSLIALTRFRGVCFRSQRLHLARLMGEFSDGFLTVVAATVMLYRLCRHWKIAGRIAFFMISSGYQPPSP